MRKVLDKLQVSNETLVKRVWPFVMALTLLGLTTSGVQPEFFGLFGRWEAISAQVTYACVLLLFTFKPEKYAPLHQYAAIMAVFIFVGKGLGFAELVVGGGYHLIGPIGERLTLALVMVIWHSYRGRDVVRNGLASE